MPLFTLEISGRPVLVFSEDDRGAAERLAASTIGPDLLAFEEEGGRPVWDGEDELSGDRPEPGGPYAGLRNERRAHRPAAAWSLAKAGRCPSAAPPGSGRSRNGFRDRSFDTRLGTLQLRIPKLRQGSYFPPFLEPRKTARRRWWR
jgi:hypothetical protein